MEFSRRSFLRGALALTAVSALPAAAFANVPTLYGDGVHDDTEALQALFDRRPVRIEGDVVVVDAAGYIKLSGGTFRLSGTVHLRSNTLVDHVTFINGGGGYTLQAAEPVENVTITSCVFESRESWDRRSLYGASAYSITDYTL